ncbi:recombinase family protein [Streptomyces sp. NPDC050507]|uniref:recombinase family protein n=1 Tax=Streptomyces sp. NPDC050507 TaxID=3365619 RepID=UPI00378D7C89
MSAAYVCIICGESEPNTIDLYVRKSKKLGRDDHRREQSTDAQTEQGHRWSHRKGYAVRKVWKDIASAFKAVKRSDFDRALAALANEEVPTLWAYAIDRFSRKGAEDLLKVIGKARVIFDMDGLDSNEPRDRRWIINRAEEAREYSEGLSKRVRDTKEEQRDAGRWVAGRAPYGYTVSRDRVLSPDEEPFICHVATRKEWSRAALVREMFRMIAEDGESTRGVCRWLNGMRVPSPGGKSWGFAYVYRMTRNPAYYGTQVIQIRPGHPEPYRNTKGELVPLRGTALITRDQQRRAQNNLAGNNVIPVPNRARDTRAKHLLTGLLQCPGCKRSMSMGGRSYLCQAATGGTGCHVKASARTTAIESYVFEAWLARLTGADDDDSIMIAVSERWTARTKPEETAAEQAARSVLDAAEADLAGLIRTRKQYTGAAERYYFQQLTEATEAVDAAKEQAAKHGSAGRVQLPFLSVSVEDLTRAWEDADPYLKRDLLRLAIDRITVHKAPRRGCKFDGDSRLTIAWAKTTGRADYGTAA